MQSQDILKSATMKKFQNSVDPFRDYLTVYLVLYWTKPLRNLTIIASQ